MHILSTPHPIVALIVVTLTLFLLSGCDSGLNGTYTPDGNSPYGNMISSLTFKPGGKVEVTTLGMTQEVSYEREGMKIKVMTDGKTSTIFTIDEKGCLDGGKLIGKFCKN
jgi:hypothetical protein